MLSPSEEFQVVVGNAIGFSDFDKSHTRLTTVEASKEELHLLLPILFSLATTRLSRLTWSDALPQEAP